MQKVCASPVRVENWANGKKRGAAAATTTRKWGDGGNMEESEFIIPFNAVVFNGSRFKSAGKSCNKRGQFGVCWLYSTLFLT